MSCQRLRITTADITTLDIDAIVCFESRVRAAFEGALAAHVNGEPL